MAENRLIPGFGTHSPNASDFSPVVLGLAVALGRAACTDPVRPANHLNVVTSLLTPASGTWRTRLAPAATVCHKLYSFRLDFCNHGMFAAFIDDHSFIDWPNHPQPRGTTNLETTICLERSYTSVRLMVGLNDGRYIFAARFPEAPHLSSCRCLPRPGTAKEKARNKHQHCRASCETASRCGRDKHSHIRGLKYPGTPLVRPDGR